MLACDHGNRPSQVLDYSTEGMRQKEVLDRETGIVYNVKTTTTTTTTTTTKEQFIHCT